MAKPPMPSTRRRAPAKSAIAGGDGNAAEPGPKSIGEIEGGVTEAAASVCAFPATSISRVWTPGTTGSRRR